MFEHFWELRCFLALKQEIYFYIVTVQPCPRQTTLRVWFGYKNRGQTIPRLQFGSESQSQTSPRVCFGCENRIPWVQYGFNFRSQIIPWVQFGRGYGLAATIYLIISSCTIIISKLKQQVRSDNKTTLCVVVTCCTREFMYVACMRPMVSI